MKLFTKGILPLFGILFWILFTYMLVSGIVAKEDMYFWWWVVAGVPFGIFRMKHWLVPSIGSSLSFTVCLWALNLIVGGLIGGFVVIVTVIKSVTVILKCIFHEKVE